MITRIAGLTLLLVGGGVLGYLGMQKYFDWLTAVLPASRTRVNRPPN